MNFLTRFFVDPKDSEAEDYLRIPVIKAKVKAKALLKPKNNG